MFQTNFTAVDWAIVAAYLLATVALGVYVNRHIHNAADYLVGGRAAGTALSVATLVGTELGLVTLVYAAMDGFNRGLSFLAIPFLALVITLIIGATGFVIGPLRRMRLTTIPEFFERRYNRRTRIVAGVICALAGVLNMGLFPKMGATFITYASGLGGVGQPIELSLFGWSIQTDSTTLLINAVTSGLILFVLLYTTLGGMVAVIVTDYVQYVVLSVGMALGLWFCLFDPRLGWGQIVEHLAVHRGGQAAFNPLSAGSYGWTYMVWQVALIGAAGVCWAPGVSRALTTRDEATTLRTFFFAAPGYFSRMAIPGFWGAAAVCFFAAPSDLAGYFSPAEVAEAPARAAHAMPLLIGKLLPPVALGLLMAGLLAAFMSTHDSYLLAWASVISQDIVGPLRKRPLTNEQSIRVTRYAVLGIGGFLLVFGVWIELPDSVWTYMGVTGTIYLAGAATSLIGGVYWKRASSTGACGLYGEACWPSAGCLSSRSSAS